MFFHLDDPATLDGPQFFARAFRLWHYRGAMRDVVMEAAREEEERGTPQQSTNAPAPRQRSTGSEAQLAAQLGSSPGWLQRQ